jgi:choline dehydrogenase-like flavoprotein
MYDYVIVGAGSAGCVLAGRLSEDSNVNVCLLEAGLKDDHFKIQAPFGFSLRPTEYNWSFDTVPQPGLNGRRGFQPRGKVLGGSSSINAMVYIRGHRTDYDHWASLGNEGWSYNDVLPYFKKAQNQERGGSEYHGTGGPLNVADLREPNPYVRRFIDAAKEMQYRETDDFNGPDQEGVGQYQVTQINGERCSAAKGYLTPNLDRPNLTVITEAQSTKVLFENKRAVAVAYTKDGQEHEVRANQEVILSCGAFQSPHLLMLSGVGPAAELHAHGIDVLHDLPGVGKNLQDHIDYIAVYRKKDQALFGKTFLGSLKVLHAIWKWRRTRTGMATSNVAEAGGFIKSDPGLDVPDLQLHFVVAQAADHGRTILPGHGYSCHICLLRPKSRGEVTLASADPMAAPMIDPNFFAEEEDLDTMVKAFKQLRQIMERSPFANLNAQDVFGAGVHSDDEIREELRNRADTVYHPVGTCKMGSDEMAVVDHELRVHGLENLRVIDASIMPTLIGGNTNAPTIMIAEKAAEMIKAT